MYAHRQRGPRTPEDDRRFAGGEPFPCEETKGLPLLVRQSVESGLDHRYEIGVVCRRDRLPSLALRETVRQRDDSAIASPPIRQHAPSNPEQPGCCIRWDIIEATPRDQEGLGDDIVGVIWIGPTEGIAAHSICVSTEQPLESHPALVVHPSLPDECVSTEEMSGKGPKLTWVACKGGGRRYAHVVMATIGAMGDEEIIIGLWGFTAKVSRHRAARV